MYLHVRSAKRILEGTTAAKLENGFVCVPCHAAGNLHQPQAQFVRPVGLPLLAEAEAPEQASAGNTAGSALDDGILKRTEWKIVSREGNTLEIAVTAPDMQALLQDQAMTILSQPDGVSQILSLLEKNNLPMREVTVSVTLDEDGKL